MKSKHQIPKPKLNTYTPKGEDSILYWGLPINPMFPSTYMYITFDPRGRKHIALDHNFIINDLDRLGSGQTTEIIMSDNKDQIIIITINKPIPKRVKEILGTIGTLSHEAMHAVTYIMEHYGYTDDEVRAYLMNDIINTYVNILYAHIKR